MYPRPLRFLVFSLFYLSLSSGSSVAKRTPLITIKHDGILNNLGKKISPSSSFSDFDEDTRPTVPVVNPTPDMNVPTFNPPSPAPPTSTDPTTPSTPTTSPQNPPNNPTNPNTGSPSTGGSWCIAKPDASSTALQVALDYACGFGGADCSTIQSGASCYEPNTVRDHASYAFNDYYQKHPGPNSCDFGGTAQITNTDPSNGNCHYPSSSTSSSTTPPANPSIIPTSIPTAPEAPTMMTPTTTFPGPTDYGEEPTGLPSMANSMSNFLLVPITLICLFSSLLVGNHL